MDSVIINIISLVIIVIGIIGTVLPVIPGSSLALTGLLVFKFSVDCTYSWWLVIIAGVFVLLGAVLDYLAPIYTTKKLGGTKYGLWGAIIGMIIGLFFPPFGFILGPFAGAFIGELIYNYRDTKRAFKAALGSFVGFLITTGYDIILSVSFFGIVVYQIFF